MEILLIEGEPRISEFVCSDFLERGDSVDHRANGNRDVKRATTHTYDGIVCDLMLHRRDGLDVLKDIPAFGVQLPLSLLTAGNELGNRVLHERVHQASWLSANAAHEIRTTLTVIQGRLEQAFQHSEGRVIQAVSLLLQQALTHLVGNAVRPGKPKGRIRTELKRLAEGAIFSISNPCEPISAEQHARLFERFFRTQSSMDRGIEGSGLGLSLSREIVRAHGGDLVLAPSAPDVVTFVMRIPS